MGTAEAEQPPGPAGPGEDDSDSVTCTGENEPPVPRQEGNEEQEPPHAPPPPEPPLQIHASAPPPAQTEHPAAEAAAAAAAAPQLPSTPPPAAPPQQQAAAQQLPVAVSLCTLVTATEAALFVVVVDEARSFSLPVLVPSVLDGVREQIEDEAVAIFGRAGTSTEVAGSVAKRTAVGGSDTDIYVHTRRPATREQARRLEGRLKRAFSGARVRLGQKAIHVSLPLVGDIDVVFSSSEAFGELPRADPAFNGNTAAQQAARALKLWAADVRAEKVPGRWLEQVALEAQRAFLPSSALSATAASPSSATSSSAAGTAPTAAAAAEPELLSGGGMQLFVAALQAMADSPAGGRLFGLPPGTGASAALRRLAKESLHVFALSRALLATGGFTDAGQARAHPDAVTVPARFRFRVPARASRP